MNQVPQPSATFGRRKLWIQILSILAVVVLIWLEPRIDEWIRAKNQHAEPSVAESSAEDLKRSDATEPASRVSPVPESSLRIEPLQKKATPLDAAALGELKEIRNNAFQSSAGLVYRAGSEDGHRLKHVMQHARDNPQKKIHGVFDGDGDRNVVLAVIDEAYIKAMKGGSDVRSERQNDRQVFTVNLRRRIGQMGGEEGERKRHPECRFVRIVLENRNEVISAYPTTSF